ncbi:hypothetical protein C8R42DRAFT_723403 [Lentinula raphanica]|nr:hypothetical protein C8R42DRAFT_723403 [Lentinula raphanica]
MAKRKNSKSEKVDDPESPDAKRRKEKDIRTSSRHPVAEHSSTSKTSSSKVSKVSTANPSNSESENDTSNSKASSSRDLRSKTSSTKASSSKASSGKLSNSKPSKKETKTTKPLSNLPASVLFYEILFPASKETNEASQIQRSSRVVSANASWNCPSEGGFVRLPANIVLNEEENNADLGDDVIELYDSEEEKNKSGSDEEEEIDTDDGSSDADVELSNNDMDTLYDNMTVKDITQPKQKKQKKSKRKSLKKGKVLESEFEDVELARLGKSSVRLAICIRNMWPKEDEPDLTLFTEELGKYGNSDLLQSLKKITSSLDPNEVKKLKKFMNYGSSQVRSDLGAIVRILSAQFYELSVSRNVEAREEIADRVRWLLDDKRYHQEVDLETRTVKGAPFSTPLIGKILRAYFMDSPSYLDTFLIKHMKQTKTVPIGLIVMITTLIDHSITEWTSGRKKKIQLTRANTVESYLFLWRTVEKSKKRAKTYIEDLPFDLFEEMMSNDIGDEDVPDYNYEAIEAAAQEKRKKRDDRSNNGSNDGSHSGSNKGSNNGSNNGSNKEDKVDNGFNAKGNDNVFGSDNVNVSDNGREIDRNGSFETNGDDVDSNEV